MNARLVIVMIALTVVPAIFLEVFFTRNMVGQIRTNRIDLVRNYGVMIGEEMQETGYLKGAASAVIDGELRQFSGLYDGRIIVVDADYEVRLDTYGLLQGRQLVTDETVRGLSGTEGSGYDTASDQVWLTYVVRDDAEEISGMILFYLSSRDLTESSDAIAQTQTMIMAPMVILMIVIALLMAHSFTRPFKGVAASFNRIAEGHWDENVEMKGFTEIEQISVAFNRMIRRLKDLEDSRQEFVSNVSHELKTPMTSMKVLADSLVAQPDAPLELYQDFMVDIAEEIDRENTIINDLLSMVRMDKTEAELNIATVNLNECLESILKRLRPIASKRNIETVLESYRSVEAECDEVKLTLALTNLVENAIKYNNAGGWVKVTLDADHKYFYVDIADSGIGIPEEAQDKIFDRFYRVDKARSRQTGGTGLGLAITKNIILMHNGQIKVKSAEDEGTTFSIRIPLTYARKA